MLQTKLFRRLHVVIPRGFDAEHLVFTKPITFGKKLNKINLNLMHHLHQSIHCEETHRVTPQPEVSRHEI